MKGVGFRVYGLGFLGLEVSRLRVSLKLVFCRPGASTSKATDPFSLLRTFSRPKRTLKRGGEGNLLDPPKRRNEGLHWVLVLGHDTLRRFTRLPSNQDLKRVPFFA